MSSLRHRLIDAGSLVPAGVRPPRSSSDENFLVGAAFPTAEVMLREAPRAEDDHEWRMRFADFVRRTEPLMRTALRAMPAAQLEIALRRHLDTIIAFTTSRARQRWIACLLDYVRLYHPDVARRARLFIAPALAAWHARLRDHLEEGLALGEGVEDVLATARAVLEARATKRLAISPSSSGSTPPAAT